MKLPNQCYTSPIKVHPQNWESTRVSLKKDWYIYYRFYNPALSSNPRYKKGKLVIVKGMNHLKILSERQAETQRLIQVEMGKLERGYNPILKKEETTVVLRQVQPFTVFPIAIDNAWKNIKASESTMRDLKSIISFIKKASTQLGYNELPINVISRKHIKMILSQIQLNRGSDSPHRFNKIRSYLMMLFNELLDLEAVESNPVCSISKKAYTHHIRKLLPPESRSTIDEYLKKFQYRFWLFTHIFFHSGSRLTEMMQVRRKDVDLEKMFFRIMINKGKNRKEVQRPIKRIALSYWEQACMNAVMEDYLFSKNLLPGPAAIKSYQITKRWNRHIKKKLGIQEDFYSLKHLNLDETSAILGIADAAAMASHTNPAITSKYYAVNELQRQQERLKGVDNKFG